MQKERAIGRGLFQLECGRMANLERLVECLPRTLRLRRDPVFSSGLGNQCFLLLDIEYGPVWGCWEDDVRGKLERAKRKAGTSAKISIVGNFHREVIECR